MGEPNSSERAAAAAAGLPVPGKQAGGAPNPLKKWAGIK